MSKVLGSTVNAPLLTGLLVIGGSTLFCVMVTALHIIQPGYDPVHQLMSELALGTYGLSMVIAFAGLALSSLGCLLGVRVRGATAALQILLLTGTLTFLGAGVFPLGSASELHIMLIAVAFISTVLAMCCLPREQLTGLTIGRAPSWPLAAATALSVFAGHDLLPIGIAQRMAAMAVVIWFYWLGYTMTVSAKARTADR